MVPSAMSLAGRTTPTPTPQPKPPILRPWNGGDVNRSTPLPIFLAAMLLACTAGGTDTDTDPVSQKRLRELEAENARLGEERGIARNAAAWFARESVSTRIKGAR